MEEGQWFCDGGSLTTLAPRGRVKVAVARRERDERVCCPLGPVGVEEREEIELAAARYGVGRARASSCPSSCVSCRVYVR